MPTKNTLKVSILPLLLVFLNANLFGQSAGINSNSGDSLLFFTNSAKTMVLTADGKLRLGDILSTAPSAVLQLNSTSNGILIPRMTTIQRDAISTPVEGLLIYNTDNKQFEVYDGTSTWDVIFATNNISGPNDVTDTDADTYVHTEKSPDEDFVRVYTDGSERVTIDNVGMMGINNPAPGAFLDLAGDFYQYSTWTGSVSPVYGHDVVTELSAGNQSDEMVGVFSEVVITATASSTGDLASSSEVAASKNLAIIGTSGTTNGVVGSVNGVFTGGNIGTNTASYGAFNIVGHDATSGTMNTAIGTASYVENTNGGNITTAEGIYVGVESPGAGVITNAIGLYIDNISPGTSSNFAIQTNAGDIVFNAQNHNASAFQVKSANQDFLLYTDPLNDRVGIGTGAPTSLIHAEQARTGADMTILTLINTGTGAIDDKMNVLFRMPATGGALRDVAQITAVANYPANNQGGLAFSTGSTGTLAEAMRLDYNGYLGVGTTNPSEKFHLENGAIMMTTVTAPGTTTDRLYNVGGDLFWNGSQLNSGSASPWTQSGTDVFLTTITDYVGIGTAAPVTQLHIQTADDNVGGAVVGTSSSTGNEEPYYYLIKSRGTSGAPSAVGTGDLLGGISWNGYDGGDYYDGATIKARTTEAWTGSAHGTQLVFQTVDATTTAVSERMVIDDNGRVGIGTTSPSGMLDITSADTEVFLKSEGTTESEIKFERAAAGPSILANGDNLGEIRFYGYDGSAYGESASILAEVNGTPAAGDMPGKLNFLTSPAGSTTPVRRMVIDDQGRIGIGENFPYDLIEVKSDDDVNMLLKTRSATNESSLKFYRAGAGETIVSNADLAGDLKFYGYDGAAYQKMAVIEAEIDGTPAAGDIPGKLEFYTTPRGSTTPLKRMAIREDGFVGIGMDAPDEVLALEGALQMVEQAAPANLAGYGKFYANSGDMKPHFMASDGTDYDLTASTPDTDWTDGASAVYNNGTKQVIIGNSTAAASYKFEVETPADATRAIAISADQNYTGAAQTFGVITDISNVGTGLKYGSYNVVRGSGTQTNSIHGTFNQVQTLNTEIGYGVYNDFTTSTGSGKIYGIYNDGETDNYFSGNVGIGTSSPKDALDIVGSAQSIRNASYSSTLPADGSNINFLRARGTESSPVIVNATDNVGSLAGFAYDGAAFGAVAKIHYEVDGTPGLGDTPGRIQFHTTPDGTNTTVERMRITNTGNIGIGTMNPTRLLHLANGHLRVSNYNNGSFMSLTRAATGEGSEGPIGNASQAIGAYNFSTWNAAVNDYDASAQISAETSTAHAAGDIPARLIFSTVPSGSDVLQTRMVIEDNGNVGIGISSPTENLHIKNTFKLDQETSEINRASDNSDFLPVAYGVVQQSANAMYGAASTDLLGVGSHPQPGEFGMEYGGSRTFAGPGEAVILITPQNTGSGSYSVTASYVITGTRTFTVYLHDENGTLVDEDFSVLLYLK